MGKAWNKVKLDFDFIDGIPKKNFRLKSEEAMKFFDMILRPLGRLLLFYSSRKR